MRIAFIRLEAVFRLTVPAVSIGNRSGNFWLARKGLANLPEFGIDHFVAAASNFSEFPARVYGDRAWSVADQARRL